MPYTYPRTIHFPDTDAAGVVFFANYLSICHEAYEEALAAAGMDVRTFFSEQGRVVPISKSNAEYLRPLYCGDKVRVELRPSLLTPDTFAVEYTLIKQGKTEKLAANVRTAHVCIDTKTRERVPLPAELLAWVNAG